MKHFEYYIDESLQEIASRAIRCKQDILLLLAYTVKAIVEQELSKNIRFTQPENKNYRLQVHVDRMNRLVYCMDKKIFSYQMPFDIYEADDGGMIIKYNHEWVIDSYLSSVLITVFGDVDCFDGTIEDIYYRVDNRIKNIYNTDGLGEDVIWKLLKDLMLYEPGYIRCDDDPDPNRMNPDTHPRYHLDINYESSATYKIGLQRMITPEEMLSILDNGQKRATLYI